MSDRVFLGTLRHIWWPGRLFPASYHLRCPPTIARWLSYCHRTHRHPANNNRCSLSNLRQPGSSSSYPPSGLRTHSCGLQAEAQFATRSITNQRTRFNYVVAALSNEYATEICNLILNPPQEDAYSTLKDQLIKRTAISERKCLQLLLTAEELGDRKPTQLLKNHWHAKFLLQKKVVYY